jgi:hypothetical protein
MNIPRLRVLDNALSPESLTALQTRMVSLRELSTVASQEDLRSDVMRELFSCAEMVVGRPLQILTTIFFAIRPGHQTTPHTDFGEYVVLYFTHDCPTGPLRLFNPNGDIEVVANRVVAFDATVLSHRQIVPSDGVRYSVALKFRHP